MPARMELRVPATIRGAILANKGSFPEETLNKGDSYNVCHREIH